MEQELFLKAKIIFHEEVERKCAELLEQYGDDYKTATLELCQAMNDGISTPPELLKEVVSSLRFEEDIEAVVKAHAQECGYRFHRTNEYNDARWELKKRIKGESSVLHIKLEPDGVIDVEGATESWNLFAYSYDCLTNVIEGWSRGIYP